ncbi:hypothetical protein ACFUCV_09105 [Specibacter sp. NPDC057265]|uniref:hypothetical protein n=1 Tax=Specibacter sp. NPDC057265 TaxID=3346075 RepID=UPI003645E2D3
MAQHIPETDGAAPEQPAQSTQDQLVQDDLNKLLGTALGLAGDQLSEHGAFMPLAVVLSNAGELSLVAVAPNTVEGGEEEELDADQMIADLFAALTSQRADNRAAAVVCDIHLPEDATDAVHVMAEHATGVGVSAVQPYRQGDGGWEFSEPFLEAGERAIWT